MFIHFPYIYNKKRPGVSFSRHPGCLAKVKTRPKTDRFVFSYLIINQLILFKVSKTAQNRVKIC